MKKINFWIMSVITIYTSMELFSYGGLFLLYKLGHIKNEAISESISNKHTHIINNFIKEKPSYIVLSPTLGWTIKKNTTSELYHSNSSGIRSNKEYALKPSHGIRRILTFGDSFTHGDDVKNSETWQALMEDYNSHIEVLNFGVSGYGLDQSYLRYLEDGKQYKTHIVLIGFMSENLQRNVNTFRPFYSPNTGIPLSKPRFITKDGSLSLIPNQLRTLDHYNMLLLEQKQVLSRLGRHDYYYQTRYRSQMLGWSPTAQLIKSVIHEFRNQWLGTSILTFPNRTYNETSEAFIVTTKLFEEFYDAVTKNGSMPVILLFPDHGDLNLHQQKQEKRYSPFLSYFNSNGYQYIDLMKALETTDVKDLIHHHYTPLANRLVAKYILNYLNNMPVPVQ